MSVPTDFSDVNAPAVPHRSTCSSTSAPPTASRTPSIFGQVKRSTFISPAMTEVYTGMAGCVMAVTEGPARSLPASTSVWDSMTPVKPQPMVQSTTLGLISMSMPWLAWTRFRSWAATNARKGSDSSIRNAANARKGMCSSAAWLTLCIVANRNWLKSRMAQTVAGAGFSTTISAECANLCQAFFGAWGSIPSGKCPSDSSPLLSAAGCNVEYPPAGRRALLRLLPCTPFSELAGMPRRHLARRKRGEARPRLNPSQEPNNMRRLRCPLFEDAALK
mmetsp:Transcript_30034/g.75683  ORF Transcript_30034/g.75683 Transcript_30034/m.75683 type:complete len:276 (-) Transcript_30034:69-896(-)